MKQIRILQYVGSLNIGGSQTMIMELYRNIDHNQIQFDFIVDKLTFSIYVLKGNTADNVIVKPMLVEVDENLMKYPYSNSTLSVNGLTFTDNGDRTVTVSGTATAYSTFALCKLTNLTDNTSFKVIRNEK